jgi:hypothetical protein
VAQTVKIHFNGAFIRALPNRKKKLAQFLYEVIIPGQKANLENQVFFRFSISRSEKKVFFFFFPPDPYILFPMCSQIHRKDD